MSMSGEASYISRFFAKFVEIIAAGIATAVSGYLLAQFGGHLSTSTPPSAAVQTDVPGSERSPSPHATAVPPVAAAASEPRPASAPNADAPAERSAREPVKPGKAAPPRKQTKPEASIAEGKPRGEESVEALVRAALVNSDANRPAAPDATPHQAGVPPRRAAVEAEPKDVPAGTAAIAPPPAVDLGVQAVPPRSVKTGPPILVEPHAPPAAAVQALPPIPRAPIEMAAPQPAPSAEHKGMFSWLSRDPRQRRVPAPTGEAPRPPMPIGEPAQAPM